MRHKVHCMIKREYNFIQSRSQWPRGLRRRSAAALLLRSWIRIPLGAWTFVCRECCVLSGRGLCDELVTRPEESYRLWCVIVCDLENLKNEEAMTRDGSQCHRKKNSNFIKKENSQPHLMQELDWATDDLYNNRTVGDVNLIARRYHPDFLEPVTKGWHGGFENEDHEMCKSWTLRLWNTRLDCRYFVTCTNNYCGWILQAIVHVDRT